MKADRTTAAAEAVGRAAGVVSRNVEKALAETRRALGKAGESARKTAPQIAAVATQMSAGYNGALLQQLNSLRALPGYSIKVLDLFALLSEAQAAPANFGFTNATAPCFVPPPAGPLLCPSPNTYRFWDPFHPTYTTGQLMATPALAAIGR